MRARSSAPSTPRSVRSKSGRSSFAFDLEHLSSSTYASNEGTAPDGHLLERQESSLEDTTTISWNWTPRKSSREHALSPLQNLTPTKLSHALGIGIATPTSRSRGTGRSSSYFLASPQSSFALSSAPTPSISAKWRRRRHFMFFATFVGGVVILSKQVPISISATSPSVRTKTPATASTSGESIQKEKAKHTSVSMLPRDTNDADSPDRQRKRLEDGVEASSPMNLMNPNNDDVVTSAEAEMFDRMLQLARRNKLLCGERRLEWEQEKRSYAILEEFGIIDAIESYRNGTKSHAKEEPQCSELPPTTSCNARNFTAFIDATLRTSDPQYRLKHLRAIFILALRLQSVPSASEIIIQYCGLERELSWDRKYGRRLLMWHNDPDLAIKILFLADQTRLPNFSSSQMSNDAILYVSATMNGPDRNSISTGGLEFGFDLWKQFSGALITAASASFVRQGNSKDVQELDASALHDKCPLLLVDNSDKDRRSGGKLPFFFHRDYQCFLDHDVFQEFRQLVAESTGQETLSTYSFVRNIVGRLGPPPRLFPGLLYRTRVSTGSNLTSAQEVGKFPYAANSRRRLSEDTAAVDAYFGTTLHPIHWCNNTTFCLDQVIDTASATNKIGSTNSMCERRPIVI